MFKTKASKVEKALKDVDGYSFKLNINTEKPRKGSFVVSIIDGDDSNKKIIELLDMPRPFKQLRDTDIDQTIKDFFSKK